MVQLEPWKGGELVEGKEYVHIAPAAERGHNPLLHLNKNQETDILIPETGATVRVKLIETPQSQSYNGQDMKPIFEAAGFVSAEEAAECHGKQLHDQLIYIRFTVSKVFVAGTPKSAGSEGKE